ncbi:MAG TPA: cytochrome P450 [Nannocystaceae bacterium]|nr:cytochrome P450 [Nannocystaceae bacterium]
MHTEAPDLDRFDVVSPRARAEIHAVYREMRRHGPVHRFTDPLSRRPSWLVLDHAPVRAVLQAADTFIREETRLRPPGPASIPPGLELVFGDILHRDPPTHTRLRVLMMKALTPRRIDGLRDRTRAIIDALLAHSGDADTFDLVGGFAYPLPATLAMEMLGLHHGESQRFRDWSADIFSDDLPRTLAAVNAFRDFIDPILDEREAHPGDDILSGFLHARGDAGERLSRAELQSMVLILFLAGHDTTVHAIANGALALVQHPEAQARLRESPALLLPALEEMFRYDGCADFASVRYAAADTELCGHAIRRGDQVFVSLLAANRDPAVFAAPDRFDIERRPAQHLAFGAGIHACVGAPLARMQAVEAFRALLARRGALELAVDPAALRWKPSRMLHGLEALPVRRRP